MPTFTIGIYKSIRSEVFYKIGIPNNLAKFIGEHLCQSLFFNKVANWRMPSTLFKNWLRHRCFLANFAKFYFFTECLQMAASEFMLNPNLLTLSQLLSSRFQYLLHYPALADWTTCGCNLITEFATSLLKEQLKPNHEKSLMHP